MEPSFTLKTGDARRLDWMNDESVHLVLTSPPYWTLKEYNEHPQQLGALADYQAFLDELDKVWGHCFRVLAKGGRLVCVVGDVCLSRRSNNGRHMVVPLHADISVRCRTIGFDYLTPIYWHKIANANYEVQNGSSFLGKPYEPNAIIKNDAEYILMFRKPGAYRSPTLRQRELSRISKDEHTRWFRQVWTDVPGASTRPPPRADVLVRRRYGTRSVRGHRDDGSGGVTVREEHDRRRVRSELRETRQDKGQGSFRTGGFPSVPASVVASKALGLRNRTCSTSRSKNGPNESAPVKMWLDLTKSTSTRTEASIVPTAQLGAQRPDSVASRDLKSSHQVRLCLADNLSAPMSKIIT